MVTRAQDRASRWVAVIPTASPLPATFGTYRRAFAAVGVREAREVAVRRRSFCDDFDRVLPKEMAGCRHGRAGCKLPALMATEPRRLGAPAKEVEVSSRSSQRCGAPSPGRSRSRWTPSARGWWRGSTGWRRAGGGAGEEVPGASSPAASSAS